MCSNTEVAGDAVSGELTALLASLGELAEHPTDPDGSVSAATWIDRIAVLERMRLVLAAAQHTSMVGFARAGTENQLADSRVHPREVGRGIGDQIGLACKASGWAGPRRLGVARALWADMPHTRASLMAGRIGEDVAEYIVTQTSHLDAELRGLVDKQLAGGRLEEMGRRAAEAAVKNAAYEVDRAGYTARSRTARKDRRVTLRPAADAMSWLTLLLPLEQGVASYASLSRHADTHVGHGDEPRTRHQVMADTAVERLTGQAHAEDVGVEVNLVIPWNALHPEQPGPGSGSGSGSDSPGAASEPAPAGHADQAGDADADADATTDADAEPVDDQPATERDADDQPDDEPGGDRHADDQPGGGWPAAGTPELLGYGPLPMGIVRDILATTEGKRWWRRLFTAPAGGALIGGDPRRRLETREHADRGFLAHLIGLRDHGHCREPYCDSPIRHYDHIARHRGGGPTTYTNGRGLCARANYAREMPGWHAETIHDGLHDQPHTVRTTTPTGHTYTSRAGPAP